MKVISIKQPWGYLLCAGIKDIENRTWKLPEKYKGERVLIHASGNKKLNGAALDEVFTPKQLTELLKINTEIYWCGHKDFGIKYDYSAIIGSVRFVDCTINHESIWAEKSEGVIVGHSFYYKENQKPIFNWLAADPILFDKPILNVKGKLGFWNYPADILICPYCGKICLHDNSDIGVPNWGNPVHECEHCKEMILESDYEILK